MLHFILLEKLIQLKHHKKTFTHTIYYKSLTTELKIIHTMLFVYIVIIYINFDTLWFLTQKNFEVHVFFSI